MPHAIALFCDDIRHEVGNKASFIGVYQQALFVNSDFPTTIPRLYISVLYVQALSEPIPREATIKAKFHGSENQIFAMPIPIEQYVKIASTRQTNFTGEPVQNFGTRFDFAFVPLTVPKPASMEIFLSIDGVETEIGALEITKSPAAPARST